MEAHLLNRWCTMASNHTYVIATLVLCPVVSDGIDILVRARAACNTRSARINLLPELPLSDNDDGLWCGTISGRDRFCQVFLSFRYVYCISDILFTHDINRIIGIKKK